MRANKYSAKPCYRGVIKFDSKREAARYDDLKLLEMAGQVRDVQLQPKFLLGTDSNPVVIRSAGYPKGRRVSYRADFRYFDVQKQAWIIEDSKGYDTSASRLRRAFVEWQYGISIEIV